MKEITNPLLFVFVLSMVSHIFAWNNTIPDTRERSEWMQSISHLNTSSILDKNQHLKDGIEHQRLLQSTSYYYVTNTTSALLPRNNYNITIGNPMRGLGPNPDWISYRDWTPALPASVGDFKWPWDKFLVKDPDIYPDSAFDWNYIESRLQEAATQNVHAVIRFYIHWPGNPFNIPSYLASKVSFIKNDTELNYDQPALKRAIKQTIIALGKRYDGDNRLFIVQAGFTGYWGEWHTHGCMINKTTSCLPPSVNNELIQWYSTSFNKTQIAVRYPEYTNAYNHGFGFFDDSFTYSTVSGSNNGPNWFFWNVANLYNVTDFWKFSPMGGEVRPENDHVFSDSYLPGTENKQDFNACAETTHATHMGYFRGWQANGYTGINGTELARARFATARMGYSFEVDKIAVAAISSSTSDIYMDVTIKQTGIAPFYYPLNLTLYCVSGNIKLSTASIQMSALVEKNARVVVRLNNINMNQTCANNLEYKLESPYIYEKRPIKWAQGSNDGRIIVSIPMRPTGKKPTKKPKSTPKSTPKKKQTRISTTAPTKMSVLHPAKKPTRNRVTKPDF